MINLADRIRITVVGRWSLVFARARQTLSARCSKGERGKGETRNGSIGRSFPFRCPWPFPRSCFPSFFSPPMSWAYHSHSRPPRGGRSIQEQCRTGPVTISFTGRSSIRRWISLLYFILQGFHCPPQYPLVALLRLPWEAENVQSCKHQDRYSYNLSSGPWEIRCRTIRK